MEKNTSALEEAKPTGEQPKRSIPPRFDGSYAAYWIFKMERYFEYHAMDDDFAKMIDIIALCMSGRALNWFRFVQNRNNLPKSWKEFRHALFKQFEGGHTMYERFIALQQDGTVRNYCMHFSIYAGILPDIPDSILEAKFMNGLDAVNRAEVWLFQPKDLLELMQTAKLVEDKNVVLKNLAVGDTSCKTMKLGATIDGRPVVVKVDSGEIHNFISRNLAKELKLPVDDYGINSVVLDSGKMIKVDEVFCDVLLLIQNQTFVEDCLPIEMEGDFEVILGMPWLRGSGGMEVDWKALTIEMNSGENTNISGRSIPLIHRPCSNEVSFVTLSLNTREC